MAFARVCDGTESSTVPSAEKPTSPNRAAKFVEVAMFGPIAPDCGSARPRRELPVYEIRAPPPAYCSPHPPSRRLLHYKTDIVAIQYQTEARSMPTTPPPTRPWQVMDLSQPLWRGCRAGRIHGHSTRMCSPRLRRWRSTNEPWGSLSTSAHMSMRRRISAMAGAPRRARAVAARGPGHRGRCARACGDDPDFALGADELRPLEREQRRVTRGRHGTDSRRRDRYLDQPERYVGPPGGPPRIPASLRAQANVVDAGSGNRSRHARGGARNRGRLSASSDHAAGWSLPRRRAGRLAELPAARLVVAPFPIVGGSGSPPLSRPCAARCREARPRAKRARHQRSIGRSGYPVTVW